MMKIGEIIYNNVFDDEYIDDNDDYDDHKGDNDRDIEQNENQKNDNDNNGGKHYDNEVGYDDH